MIKLRLIVGIVRQLGQTVRLTRTEWAAYMADFGEYRRTCPDLP